MMDYFPEKPWACKCGCGFDRISIELVSRLQVARFLAGIPFQVVSACRCPIHNANEGGKKNSAHLTGEAADIKAVTDYQRGVILRAMIHAGFQRIGVAKTFIHGDVRPGEATWLY